MLYRLFTQAMMRGQVDLENDDVRAILIDGAAYVPNGDTDSWLSDVPALARVAVASVSGRSVSVEGWLRADDLLFAGVAGPTIERVVLYRHDGGADNLRRLIYVLEPSDVVSGLPTIAPVGQDVRVIWAPSGVFRYRSAE